MSRVVLTYSCEKTPGGIVSEIETIWESSETGGWNLVEVAGREVGDEVKIPISRYVMVMPGNMAVQKSKEWVTGIINHLFGLGTEWEHNAGRDCIYILDIGKRVEEIRLIDPENYGDRMIEDIVRNNVLVGDLPFRLARLAREVIVMEENGSVNTYKWR